ncbi:hypothetical protein [Salinirussus salinus]|jgi:hypothetical protein|uniref:hypothetical protein n=1 Tax=Salinirussus salinus TaxID=1198300 RepID=UPI00135B62CA|nr:hypothetical protein [Salinirussus salinus]
MIDDATGQESSERLLRISLERYLQNKGKDRGGERGNDDWTGIVPENAARSTGARVIPGRGLAPHEPDAGRTCFHQ